MVFGYVKALSDSCSLYQTCSNSGFQVYEVMDKIGEGGYAKIFLVEDGDDEFGSSTCVLTEDKRNQLAIKVRLVNAPVSVNSGSF